jgi:hypothetical protein
MAAADAAVLRGDVRAARSLIAEAIAKSSEERDARREQGGEQ